MATEAICRDEAGSNLMMAEDGTYYAMAQWPSGMLPATRARMRESAESYPPVLLDVLYNHLRDVTSWSPAGPSMDFLSTAWRLRRGK